MDMNPHSCEFVSAFVVRVPRARREPPKRAQAA